MSTLSGWRIAKFGGTSMATIDSMSNCAQIVFDQKANIVVVSATSGTTNKLVELCEKSALGEWDLIEPELNKLFEKHFSMATEAQIGENATALLENITAQTFNLLKGCALIRECSMRAKDSILSYGELSSSIIFSGLMKKLTKENPSGDEKSVLWYDSRLVLKTSEEHGHALPNIEKIAQMAKQNFTREEAIYVGQGFIGSSDFGTTTTLGRGGSDYSAALYAEAVDATQLQIWTDVPGMASTDPRLCPDAKSIEQLSFREAAEMATFGAKILHPATIAPAIRKEIPILVGSTFDPNGKATLIEKQSNQSPCVRAVTLRKNQAIITISNPKMLNASGFLKRIFEVFDEFAVSVDAITTSEISVAMTIDRNLFEGELSTKNMFLAKLNEVGKVEIEQNVSLIGLIGNKIPETPGLGENIFKALDGINVRMITQGASQHNFCFLVYDHEAEDAVRRLHQHFISGEHALAQS